MIITENLIAVNTLDFDPNARGESPMVNQLVKIDPGAMVAGIVEVDIASPFGLGKGEVYGIQLLSTIGADNEIIGASVALHATDAGKLTITLHSNDAVSITNLGEIYALILGRILPYDAS